MIYGPLSIQLSNLRGLHMFAYPAEKLLELQHITTYNFTLKPLNKPEQWLASQSSGSDQPVQASELGKFWERSLLEVGKHSFCSGHWSHETLGFECVLHPVHSGSPVMAEIVGFQKCDIMDPRSRLVKQTFWCESELIVKLIVWNCWRSIPLSDSRYSTAY